MKDLIEQMEDRGPLGEKISDKVFTPKKIEQWIAELNKVNKYKGPKKTVVTGIDRVDDSAFVILCADELSMFRVAQYYGRDKKDFGFSKNLNSFYVMHRM